MMRLLSLQIVLFSLLVIGGNAVTLYEYFVPGGGIPSSGLKAGVDKFTLNGKDITLYSGAMHYFRVHPYYWRDTLKKLRAAGLNAVETYMPWNLHNPEIGEFDFGSGGNAMSHFLDIRSFIQIAQEEDLFVILRPGPYICAEWEFGGLPYWLLKDHNMAVRTAYDTYMDATTSYYDAFAPQVNDLTFTNGGPIIAVQIENEFGHFGYDDEPRDKVYLQNLLNLLDLNGFYYTLYFTSDSAQDTFDWGALPTVLQTTNFQSDVNVNLDALKLVQPDKPLMVMEFWTGWFDHWLADIHSTRDPDVFASNLELIFLRNSSVNMYMFIGGTNFGFMAGANRVSNTPAEYTPTITSYDYDAPLTEAGDYGEKYMKAKDLIAQYNPLSGTIENPDVPLERTKVSFGNFSVEEEIEFQDLISQCTTKISDVSVPVSMEELGLGYGYIVYSTTVELDAGDHTLLIRGHVRDMAQILINGQVVTDAYNTILSLSKIGFWNGRDQSLTFNQPIIGLATIDIMVENLGRVNYGKPHYFKQKKGLWEGDVMVDGSKLEIWQVSLMGFEKNFVNGLSNWMGYTGSLETPSAYKVSVDVPSPGDTFLDMSNWNKGIVILNGFNLGRYWTEGPQRSLYIPAPLFNAGDNEFVIFEQYSPSDTLNFIDHPILSRND